MMRPQARQQRTTAEIIRFPRGDQMHPSNRIQPSDRRYLGVEVFRGGTYLGTALTSKSGMLAYDAMNEHVGYFPDFDAAVEAIFAAALD